MADHNHESATDGHGGTKPKFTVKPTETGSGLDPSSVLQERRSPPSTSMAQTVESGKDIANIDKERGEDSSKEETKSSLQVFPSPLSRNLIFVAVSLSIFLVTLDMTIIATAIPSITDEFHSLSSIGWYGSAFLLTGAAFQSTWGKAFKFFPLKGTFLLSVFVFELGSLICGVAQNNTTLIVGRAIAGAGGAGIAAGAYTIIAFVVPPKQRPAFMGILGGTYGIASAIGPLIGGVFTDRVSWRWCFYVNLPIGGAAASIILLFFKTPESALKANGSTLKEKVLQMDLVGTFLTMGAVVCFLLAAQWGGVTYPWSSSVVVGTLVGFGAITIATVVLEWKLGERAMFVARLMKSRAISASITAAFFLSGSFFLLLYYLPIYFQAIGDSSAAQSGVQNLPLVLSVSICTVGSGFLISKLGYFFPFVLGGSILFTIGAGLTYTLDIDSPPSHWIGYQILVGIGNGVAVQVPMVVVQSVVNPSDISTVSGMILFARTMGGAIFVSAGQSAFTNVLINNIPSNAPGVSISKLIATGATDLRTVFLSDAIPGILRCYMDGLRAAYAIVIVTAGSATVFALLMPWQSLKSLKKPNET